MRSSNLPDEYSNHGLMPMMMLMMNTVLLSVNRWQCVFVFGTKEFGWVNVGRLVLERQPLPSLVSLFVIGHSQIKRLLLRYVSTPHSPLYKVMIRHRYNLTPFCLCCWTLLLRHMVTVSVWFTHAYHYTQNLLQFTAFAAGSSYAVWLCIRPIAVMSSVQNLVSDSSAWWVQ